MKFIISIIICLLPVINVFALQQESLDDIFDIGTVQSLVIQKNGEIIHEEYNGSIDGNDPTNIKSASKSIISLLIGIAIDKGFIDGVDHPIGDFFPEYFEQNPDSAKAAITIQDLLTMRSGLETTSFRNYGRWVMSNDWVEFTLDQPFVEEPGGRMVYSTGTSHLLSVILTKATGMSTRAFANEHLFEPMNIEIGGWDRDPQGYYMGGNNLAMSPLDLLKIGTMMMDVGEYNGRQIVSKEWVLESVQVYTRSNYNPYNYGYMWWRRPIGGYQLFFAWGNGGQYIMILPELESVISITSDLGRSSGSRRYQERIFDFLRETIIPFIEESDSVSSS
jgi:CubicO group peptidase (beta-lactamase class C family)